MEQENLTEKDLTLVVVLPSGVEKTAIVHGSKPMLDLLVILCAKYHLNPSGHTIELISANRNHIKFKPNAMIGTLEAEKILLKPKGIEDKNKKTGPQMPEATVRLIINYRKSQKTILRVNPRVPIQELLPSICEKCEFDLETTVLLRDVQSEDPLDLNNSLNDFGLREVYARDVKGVATEDAPVSPTYLDPLSPSKDKTEKEKENKGLFSLFRRSKKKHEQALTESAPASPVLRKQRPVSLSALSAPSPTYNSNTMPSDLPKKRRAPLPPMLKSTGSPLGLRHRQTSSQSEKDPVFGLSRHTRSSSESCLKRSKRKAPLPPSSPSATVTDEAPLDKSVKGVPPQSTLEEIQEQEETGGSGPRFPGPATDTQKEESSSLNLSADVSMETPPPERGLRRSTTTNGTEGDQSCDLSSHGKLESTSENHTIRIGTTLNVEMSSPDLEDNVFGDSLVQTEEAGPLAKSSPTPDGLKDQSSAAKSGSPRSQSQSPAPASPPGPRLMQDAEVQVSDQPHAENCLDQPPGGGERPVSEGADRPQQDDLHMTFPTHRESSLERREQASPTDLSSTGPGRLKKDMATSTEELTPGVPADATPQGTPSRQGTSLARGSLMFVPDIEPKPKPKPSNELTREYIPKVGLTTYTVVPQKSLEKLRFFEVELTLEAPPVVPTWDVGVVSLEAASCSKMNDLPRGMVEKTGALSSIHRKESQLNNGTTTSDSSGKGNLARLPQSPSAAAALLVDGNTSEGTIQSGPTAEVKEKKIPPATKPKPCSFRLPQHKRTPGYYVTSAAVKSLRASPGSGLREAPGSPVTKPALEPAEEDSFPPPPPPLSLEEGGEGVHTRLKSQKREAVTLPHTTLTRQWSLPCKEPSVGLSLEKFRSFAAPRPYIPANPTRFAQAVTSAVKRSQSVSDGPALQSPRTPPPFSPVSCQYAIKELKEPSQTKAGDKEQPDQDEQGGDGRHWDPGTPSPSTRAGQGGSFRVCPDQEMCGNGPVQPPSGPESLFAGMLEPEADREK